MCLGHFAAVVTTAIFLSSTANACSYYEEGICGFSSPSRISQDFSRISELPGPGFYVAKDFHVSSAEATPQSVSMRHGGGNSGGHFSFGDQGGGSSGGSSSAGSSSANGSVSSLFNVGFAESKAHETESFKLALNGLGFINLADSNHDFPGFDGAFGRGEDARATPLPASWTMMLVGFGLMGLLACYRRLKSTDPVRTTWAHPARLVVARHDR